MAEGVKRLEKIWDPKNLVQTDHLTEEQWDILEDIFKDFK